MLSLCSSMHGTLLAVAGGEVMTNSCNFPPFQQFNPKYPIGQQLITPLYQSPIFSFAPPASFFSLT